MDVFLLVLRVAHVGGAMLWFGGAILNIFFLDPAARALGPAAGPFMEHVMNRRRMGIFFPVVALVTVVSGAVLYWRDSGGLNMAWITSGPGIAFTVGGLAAIAALVGGMMLIPPAVAAQTEIRNTLAKSGGSPTAEHRERLVWAERRMQLATRLDLPLLVVAGLTMAVARYL